MNANRTKPLYLDWAATAPLHPAAREAMDEAMDGLASGALANPSSQHAAGRAARRALNAARERIGDFLAVPADAILFVSGGTEAVQLGLGADAPARLVSSVEHAAVREAAPEAASIPVDGEGRIIISALERMLDATPRGSLVAVQQANNETGVVQDIAAIAAIVHGREGRLLVDAVQAAGKLPLPRAADFIAVSAHKLGGPAGVGAVVARCKDGLRAVQRGGGQEGGLRGGTENLIGIIGFAAAVTAFDGGWMERARRLQQRLETGAHAAGGRINGSGADRLPTISSIHLAGVPAATQLMALDIAGIAVSQGPACSSGTLKRSETLVAMGLDEAAGQSLRISTGWTTCETDIDAFLAAWSPLARRRAA